MPPPAQFIVKNAPAEQLNQLSNPQLLLNQDALNVVKAQFVARIPSGGEAIFQQVLAALKGALAVAIHDVFLVGLIVTAIAFCAVFFLREIPLQKTHSEAVTVGVEPVASREPE